MEGDTVERVLQRGIDELAFTFAGAFGHDIVDRYVHESYQTLYRTSRVKTHLPVLALKFAAERLRTAAALSPSSHRLGLTDAHNGLRVFNKTVADHLNLTMNGMSHASEFVKLIVENHWRVAEEPVEILYTEYSMSKGQPLLNGVNIVFDGFLRGRMRR